MKESTEPRSDRRPRWLPFVAGGLALLLGGSVVFGLTHQGSVGGPGVDPSTGQPAPEFAGITDWQNSAPLTMASLKGRVVLVDLWTYSCINCQRTFPYLRQWHRAYSSQGLVIVGVHSPEFEFEKDLGNVRAAVKHYGVEWPVAVDPAMATWNAWGNQYWPAEYLVDKDGRVVHSHFGEGEYEQTEAQIRSLLKAAGHSVGPAGAASIDPGLTADSRQQTAELYASAARNYNIPVAVANRVNDYVDPGGQRQPNKIYWNGSWKIGDEFAEHPGESPPGKDYFLVNYRARQVHVVAQGPAQGARAYLTLDGAEMKPSDAGPEVRFDAEGHAFIDIGRSDLYTLVKRADFGQHELKVSPVAPGFRLFTFTFGS